LRVRVARVGEGEYLRSPQNTNGPRLTFRASLDDWLAVGADWRLELMPPGVPVGIKSGTT
jgi:hypothetical protein